MQVIQNDILRICNRSKLSDKVSIPELHKKCKIISLKQRMQKQLLWLMYVSSRDVCFLKVPARVTRNADKVVFKVPARIIPVYESSPFYLGTKLWNNLSEETQKKDNVHLFKKDIDRLYR